MTPAGLVHPPRMDTGRRYPKIYYNTHACMHVARKQRTETYLDQETIERLENEYSESVSAVIRSAVAEKLERDGDE